MLTENTSGAGAVQVGKREDKGSGDGKSPAWFPVPRRDLKRIRDRYPGNFGASCRIVFLELASEANQQHSTGIEISDEVLADKTGLSPRTMFRVKQALQGLKIVSYKATREKTGPAESRSV